MGTNSSKQRKIVEVQCRSILSECVADLEEKTRNQIDHFQSRMTKSVDFANQRILSRQIKLENKVHQLEAQMNGNCMEVVTENETDSSEGRTDRTCRETRLQCEDDSESVERRTSEREQSECKSLTPIPTLTSPNSEQRESEYQPQSQDGDHSNADNVTETPKEIADSTADKNSHSSDDLQFEDTAEFVKKERCLKAFLVKNWLFLKLKTNRRRTSSAEDDGFEIIEIPQDYYDSDSWTMMGKCIHEDVMVNL